MQSQGLPAGAVPKEAIEKNTGLCLHLTRGEARQGDIQIQGMEGGKDTEAYRLSISPAGVEIAGTESSIFWGMQTLIQIIEQCGTVLPGIKIVDTPALPNRGFYHDVTRGRVPKLETLKTGGQAEPLQNEPAAVVH